MKKKNEQPLKVNTTFEELMKITTKGNPVSNKDRKKMINLDWIGWTDSQWSQLFTFDIDEINENIFGVLLIWQKGSGVYICTGQGNIKDSVFYYKRYLTNYVKTVLFVAWAEAKSSQVNGIEAYLNNRCKPIMIKKFPGVTPIKVNLPNEF
ncbi:MAG: hypothetical protein ABSD71_03580 [Bacteroidales bacterium]|jgi:hypothetical protein